MRRICEACVAYARRSEPLFIIFFEDPRHFFFQNSYLFHLRRIPIHPKTGPTHPNKKMETRRGEFSEHVLKKIFILNMILKSSRFQLGSGIDLMKKWGGRDFQSKLNCVFDHLDSWKESLKSFFELVIEMEYKKINEQKCKHEVQSLFNGQEQEKTNVFALQVCLYYPIVMFNAYFWVKVVCLGILLNERRMKDAPHAAQRCLGDYLMDVLGYVWWISQLQMVFFWKKTPKTMLTKSLSCVEWALGELKSMRWKPEIIHLEIHN